MTISGYSLISSDRCIVIIPDTAAYTFESSDNSVSWCMAIHIGIDRWPDWKQNIDLVLCPDVKIEEITD